MNKKSIVAVIGPGEDCPTLHAEMAFELGKALARNKYNVINGGRNQGVMEAVSRGVQTAGGTVVGIVPDADGLRSSEWLTIEIKTGMGSARNNILILSADVVVSIGSGPGTLSEQGLTIKAKKPLIIMMSTPGTVTELSRMGNVMVSSSVDETMDMIKTIGQSQESNKREL